MVIEYQGEQNGIPTKFTIRIIGNNISKTSSNYQIDLLVGDKKLPTFKTLIHKSLANCLKEIYLFRKYNGIKFDASSEIVAPKVTLYDSILYNYHKKTLFLT
jgi:hypothetical protein